MRMPLSCMGGWGCPVRDRCSAHLVTSERHEAAESLCETPQRENFRPVHIVARPVSRASSSGGTASLPGTPAAPMTA